MLTIHYIYYLYIILFELDNVGIFLCLRYKYTYMFMENYVGCRLVSEDKFQSGHLNLNLLQVKQVIHPPAAPKQDVVIM